MPSIELDGLEVNLYRSVEDGSLIVDITGPEALGDQNDDGSPKLRVWLNEGRLYENPLKGEPFSMALVGNLSEGFEAVGPFEDHNEAEAHFRANPTLHPTWIMSLTPPSAREEDRG